MENKTIIKNAGFFEGALKNIKEQSKFNEHPFQTIFSALGYGLALTVGGPLGLILAIVAGVLGYGPGYIGKLIDNYMKSSSGNTIGEMDLSESSLKGASTYVASKVLSIFGEKKDILASDETLNEIYSIKGSLNANDILTSCYVNKNNKIKKVAAGRFEKLKNFFGKVGKGDRLPVVSGLFFGLLKSLAFGLAAVGVVGGIRSMMGKEPSKGLLEKEKKEPSEKYKGYTYYSNEKRDVEDTLIQFLDATIENFSKTFERIKNKPLKDSPQMGKILTLVSQIGESNIVEVNK